MKPHQLDGQGQLKQVSEISDTVGKEKVKSETFEYLTQNMAVLNNCFDFHDRI